MHDLLLFHKKKKSLQVTFFFLLSTWRRLPVINKQEKKGRCISGLAFVNETYAGN
jgi:hypothetical protein